MLVKNTTQILVKTKKNCCSHVKTIRLNWKLFSVFQCFDAVWWVTGKVSGCKNVCFKTPWGTVIVLVVNESGWGCAWSTLWVQIVLACHVRLVGIKMTKDRESRRQLGLDHSSCIESLRDWPYWYYSHLRLSGIMLPNICRCCFTLIFLSLSNMLLNSLTAF